MKLVLLMVVMALAACGDTAPKSSGGPFNGSPNATTNANPGSCGDGEVNGEEFCDSAIESGPGSCPTSCTAPSCTTATLEGSVEDCSARCTVEPVGCSNGDGCCSLGCDANNDSDCSNLCGDGSIEGPELCDGNCPTSCDDGNACTNDSLSGSAANCSASCTSAPLDVCQDGDGCCPPSCNANNDSDCGANCGNGVLEPGETCDGDCPTACNDGNACTTDTLLGAAATCNVVCQGTPIQACINGDGCCPAGCTSGNDSDCSATCGNGTVDPGETCDGNCPTSCNDGNACTVDQLVGSPTQCNVQCSANRINTCRTGDGCCPAGCSNASDGDCACSPETCETLGYSCGTVSDGCGSTLNCGTCTNGNCNAGICGGGTGSGSIGDPCSSINDCGPDAGTCDTSVSGGVCTALCLPTVIPCPAGSGCALLSLGGQQAICLPVCNSDSDCRSGFTCLPDLLSMRSLCTP